jgi:hypothetical protein
VNLGEVSVPCELSKSRKLLASPLPWKPETVCCPGSVPCAGPLPNAVPVVVQLP